MTLKCITLSENVYEEELEEVVQENSSFRYHPTNA